MLDLPKAVRFSNVYFTKNFCLIVMVLCFWICHVCHVEARNVSDSSCVFPAGISDVWIQHHFLDDMSNADSVEEMQDILLELKDYIHFGLSVPAVGWSIYEGINVAGYAQ